MIPFDEFSKLMSAAMNDPANSGKKLEDVVVDQVMRPILNEVAAEHEVPEEFYELVLTDLKAASTMLMKSFAQNRRTN
jgi:hypothetical protein